MKNQHKFRLRDADSLIVLRCKIGIENISMALDTGASHTVIDLTQLLIAEYSIVDSIGKVQIETANGMVEALLFRLNEFTALGMTRKDIEICSYDFFTNHIFSDFDGVLGIDFLRDTKICIDFRKSLISMH